MKPFVKKLILLLVIGVSISYNSSAQLQLTNVSNAQALVQKLLGQGIVVSNVTTTGSPLASGFFNNISGTNIGLDSGLALSNGRVKTIGPTPNQRGMDGNGVLEAYNGSNPADSSATGAFASSDLNSAGDTSLTRVLGNATFDAMVLEFDFVPLGDTVKFRYVFGSEEYPTFPCQGVTDAFGFFISGPGIGGNENIALIPGTNFPVTIDNIQNSGGPCTFGGPYFPQYYVSNRTNVNFTYNAHTTIFTAVAGVQPCQTYHLKLVVADVGDHIYDSGVLLEAGSLSSNAISIKNVTQTDQNNNSYLVEGCSSGAFKIKRPKADASALVVNLSYTGTATNGVDMQTLPAFVTIPADSIDVTVDVLPIIDNIPEGIETINVYALAGCASGAPTDSTVIQIRDYDTLGIAPDTAIICKNTTIQLTASPGYTTYQWDPDPTLSNTTIRNPIASPVNNTTTYYCTSTEGTCQGRDSSFIILKKLDFISKQGVYCKNDATGQIQVAGGAGWISALYNINNGPWQPTGVFNNLPAGIYTVKITDGGCIDSLVIDVPQLFPDLVISNALIAAATCSGTADGMATIIVNGGNPPYSYSTDGINFQNSNILNLTQGSYTVTVRDVNGCLQTRNIVIPLFNPLTLDAGSDITICEGKTGQLNAMSNGAVLLWSPAPGLSDVSIASPIASPTVTTKYYLAATLGTLCSLTDSVTVFVNPAPIANAGVDQTICFGTNTVLNGSGGTQFFWSPSSYLSDRRIAAPTVKMLPGNFTYTLNVIDANNCASLQPDLVTITVTREAKVFAGNDTTLAIGQPLTLQAIDISGSAYTQYEWIPHDGLSDPFIANPIALPDRNMWYTVLARNALGCTARDDIKITVYKGPEIYVPQAFSPDGNGTNDILKAVPAGIASFHYFRIYDRWGKLMFQTTEPLNGWDGKLKGVYQPLGTYVWMAEGVDYKGNVVYRKGTVIIMK